MSFVPPLSPPARRARMPGVCPRRLAIVALTLLGGLPPRGVVAAESTAAPDRVDYVREVKPLLSRSCGSCHGALQQKSGLRLDVAAFMKAGGDSGPAIAAGKADESLLVDALLGRNGVSRMPLDAEPLREEQIALIRRWIDQGAESPADEPVPPDPRQHWAFQRPRRPAIPDVVDPARAGHPIDAFVAAEHAKRGIVPRPEADKATLLRRVSLDVIGLPPTRDELRDFLEDTSPDAYEKVVDRLLASPHYGVRWGRHWMDVWRYSDWAGWGEQVRDSQPHIWRWRDWIVESLNAGRGYDQMVIEMLAGDELAPTDPHTLRATGYLVRNFKLLSRETWMQDTVNHTAKAFLGLTMECARCHDHMYDPVLQEEYYRVRAIFEPHKVRIDQLPGQPDTKLDGLPRAYDADLAAETLLYIRGDERTPRKDSPVAPGVPAVLGGSFVPTPVALPPEVSSPILQSHVRENLLRQADDAIAEARRKHATARDNLRAALQARLDEIAKSPQEQRVEVAAGAPASGTVLQAEAALELAARKIATAEASRASLAARITADVAAFTTPSASDVPQLAVVAGRAEREHALRLAEEKVLAAEQAAVVAQLVQPFDEKARAALEAAHKKLSDARAALAKAREGVASESPTYTAVVPTNPARSTGRRLAFARWLVDRDNPLAARVAVNHIWNRHFGRGLVPTVFDFGLNGKPPAFPELLDWLAVELMDGQWRMKPLHRLILTSRTYRQASTHDVAAGALDPDNTLLWKMPTRRMEAEIVRDSILHVAGELSDEFGGPDLGLDGWFTVKRRSIFFRHAQEKQMPFMKLFDAAAVTECYARKESIIPQQALALANSEITLVSARLLARRMAAASEPESFIEAAFERILTRAPTAAETAACREFLTQQERCFASRRDVLSTTAGDPGDGLHPAADPVLRARENLTHVLLNHHEFVTVQ